MAIYGPFQHFGPHPLNPGHVTNMVLVSAVCIQILWSSGKNSNQGRGCALCNMGLVNASKRICVSQAAVDHVTEGGRKSQEGTLTLTFDQ